MANGTTKITRTFGSPTDRDKWTLSMWLKLNQVQEQGIFHAHIDANNYTNLEFGTNGQLTLYDKLAGSGSCTMVTKRLFRDFSAWYHLVLSWDSGNATPGDRVIFWINGVRETAFTTETYPAQDADSAVNGANLHEIGAKLGSYDFAGDMSWVQFVDGLILTPTSFGSTDPTSGIWKIKPGAYGTPGNNGFTLAMEDRANLDLDTSSNAATFATTGTLTPTNDNPSNNFCTMNYLDNYWRASVFSNGNNKLTGSTSNNCFNTGTLAFLPTSAGVYSGKWYWEALIDDANDANQFWGIVASTPTSASDHLVDTTNSKYIYDGSNGKICPPSTTGGEFTYGDSYTTGDYIAIYLDFDNSKLYFSKNGVIQNSGTGAALDASLSTSDGGMGFWTPVLGNGASTNFGACSWNFGNGVFGSTLLTGTTYSDNDSIGTFKYSPNDGGASSFDGSAKNFMAFCTKNLKAYG